MAFAGGTALGFAHVGVLKWLEANHVPIDFVAGTSMGGLVGGMYATGSKADEIRDFVRGVEWAKVFGPATPYQQLGFRWKQDFRDLANTVEFGWRGHLRLPPGLNAGEGVSLLISRFAAPYSNMKTFDDLPTPFRCVATDLVQRKQVVLENGSLSTALRATMSLPGIFDPVQMGQMSLVDGGVLDNLPVDVVKKMGAEIVIAVTLDADGPYDPSKASLLDVAGRSLDIMLLDNERRNLSLADLVLSPDLSEFAATDFSRAEELENKGYEAAEAKARFLKTLEVSDSDWEVYLETRKSRQRHWEVPRSVVVNGAGKDEHQVEQKLKSLAGHAANPAPVESAIREAIGAGLYETASYEETKKDGQPGLVVNLHEKNYGPPFMNFGVTVDGSRFREARFNFAGRVTFLNAGFPLAEWRTDFSLGNLNNLATEYYLRLRSTPWFLAPRGFLGRELQDLYQNNERTAEYGIDRIGAGVDLGYALSARTEFRLGAELSHVKAAVEVGDQTLPRVAGNESFVRARWAYEGTDDALLPRNGFRATSEARWMLDSPEVHGQYPAFESHLLAARQITTNWFFAGTASGGTTFHQTTPYGTYTLGGPLQLSALGPSQLRGDNYYNGTFYVFRQIYQDPLGIFSRSYFAAGYEMGSAFADLASSSTFQDGVLGWVAVTRLGVLFVGGSYGERGQGRFFFRLGRVF